MSSSIRSSPSELEDESEPPGMWLVVLPTELDMCILSWLPIMDHRDVVVSAGPKSPWRRAPPPGMFMAPRPPMVGDESGEDCSARVEWWRLVAAREKSRPRDLRGRALDGDA